MKTNIESFHALTLSCCEDATARKNTNGKKLTESCGNLIVKIQLEDSIISYNAALINPHDDEYCAQAELDLCLSSTIDEDTLEEILSKAENTETTVLLLDEKSKQKETKTGYRFVTSVNDVPLENFAKLFRDAQYLVHDDFRIITFY